MPHNDTTILQQAMPLRATPAQVREFIFTPDRILDYSPTHDEGGVLTPGEAIYCRGAESMFALERVAPVDDPELITVKVHTAQALEPPHTLDQIKEAVIFTMFEDWHLQATDDGTLLTKTWRDLEQFQFPEFPMAPIIAEAAEAESPLLIDAWNRAAQ